jgi:glycosyltransferase involved in cell wall biosynthesis
MFAGLPTVAFDIGGVSDAVREGETGFLVEPKNIEEFKSRLLKLLNDSDLRQKMGNRALEVAKRDFSMSVMIDKYEEIFKKVLKK